MQQIYQIWSHQIEPNREKYVYGRGSPEMKFLSDVAKGDKQKEFQGALLTTIYQAGFSEVYGQNPYIDSTAFMISTSSWILDRSLRDGQSLSETPISTIDECNILFSKLASEGHPHLHAFYEWVNPITDQPEGSFPFRTGISAIRTAIVDILEKIKVS